MEEWRTTDLTYWRGIFDIDTGNIDTDGNPEFIFSVTDGNAYIYDDVTQTQDWQSSFNNTRAVAVLDVDQDDDIEFLVGTSNGNLYAFDGQSQQQEWQDTLSTQTINSVKLADVNSDLIPELVVTDNSYFFNVFYRTICLPKQIVP